MDHRHTRKRTEKKMRSTAGFPQVFSTKKLLTRTRRNTCGGREVSVIDDCYVIVYLVICVIVDINGNVQNEEYAM